MPMLTCPGHAAPWLIRAGRLPAILVFRLGKVLDGRLSSLCSHGQTQLDHHGIGLERC